jgi:hypothetical protein
VASLGPIAGLAVGAIDFENMDFVKDSAPVIQGQRAVAITTDDLVFAQTLSSGLATTVLPIQMLRALSQSRASSVGRVDVSHSYSYRSPSATQPRGGNYSRMQTPIAGIAVTEAIQIGLAGAAMVQSQVNASAGSSCQIFFDKVNRLLRPEARLKMPGVQPSTSKYTRALFDIGKGIDLPDNLRDKMNWPEANITIEWSGNPYGEIGTPIVQRNLQTSTDWTRSSAMVVITKLDLPQSREIDPRAWPIVFNYEGSFDPVGNGHWEFTGQFEIDAFGGLKFNKHDVVSRALLEFAVGKPEDAVRKGPDVVVAVPAIPQEQVDFLKANMPQ